MINSYFCSLFRSRGGFSFARLRRERAAPARFAHLGKVGSVRNAVHAPWSRSAGDDRHCGTRSMASKPRASDAWSPGKTRAMKRGMAFGLQHQVAPGKERLDSCVVPEGPVASPERNRACRDLVLAARLTGKNEIKTTDMFCPRSALAQLRDRYGQTCSPDKKTHRQRGRFDGDDPIVRRRLMFQKRLVALRVNRRRAAPVLQCCDPL
jgi:hypothetical protein